MLLILLFQLAFLSLFVYAGGRMHNGAVLAPPYIPQFPGHLEWSYTPRRKVRARKVGIACPGTFPFIIQRERCYHRLLKWLGIAHELQVECSDTNRRLYFITDYPQHLAAALQSVSFREHLHAVFDHSAKALFATPDRIWCATSKEHLEKPGEFFIPYAEWLPAIQKEAAAIPVQEEGNKGEYYPLALGFMGVHMALILTSSLGFVPWLFDSIDTMEMEKWLSLSWHMGTVIAFLWCLLIVLVFYRTSWSAWVLGDFTFIGIVGIMLSTAVFARQVNVALDDAPPQMMVQPIVEKSCSLRCGKSIYIDVTLEECLPQNRMQTFQYYKTHHRVCSTMGIAYKHKPVFRYSLLVPHWRQEEKAYYTLKVSNTFFDQAAEGDALAIPVHQGALGVEWINKNSIRLFKKEGRK